MAPILESVEIARPPEDVFAYIDDLSRHHEWDAQILETRVETEGPTRVGSRATDTRKVPFGRQQVTYEVTEHEPPRRAAFRVINGPVRPFGSLTVEPVGDGSRSRLTLEIEFRGHGLAGKLLAPLAKRDAQKNIPQNHARLKQRLESGASS